MHTGRMSCHSTQKGVKYYVSNYHMRSIFLKFCVRLFTLCKISTAIFESCGAIYRRICEMFSVLQSASGLVTDFENRVQIDS